MARHRLIAAATAVVLACNGSWGQEARTDTSTGEGVEATTQEATLPRRDALSDVDLNPYRSWQKIKEDLSKSVGVDFALEFSSIYQQTSGGIEHNSALEDTLGLYATWAIFRDNNGIDKAGIGFQAETRGNPSSDEFTEMTSDIGTLWSPNDSTSDDYSKINQLWWGHKFAEGRFAYIIGKIDPTSYVNGNRFAGSGNTQFFGQPFATNPARAFPDNGLGFEGRVLLTKDWYVTGVISDGNANSTYSPFKTIEGVWFDALETGIKTKFEGLGEGNYRITGWHRDTVDAGSSNGWALSFDQDLGDTFGAFFRYGGNDGELLPIEQIASGGISLLHPFGRKHDSAGVGVSWTQPSSSDQREEYSSEVYYRLQLTQFTEFSLSAQAVFNPSASDQDTIGVFGARIRLLF